ncbi:hypothetical protein ILYODFUR_022199 [Ilyodon furcidens]|uniref:Uncharacterized protein n=1 Tax=Ilyodon furcidens TaxID=33524 RepID=A0ABV0VGQ1_9TELE
MQSVIHRCRAPTCCCALLFSYLKGFYVFSYLQEKSIHHLIGNNSVCVRTKLYQTSRQNWDVKTVLLTFMSSLEAHSIHPLMADSEYTYKIGLIGLTFQMSLKDNLTFCIKYSLCYSQPCMCVINQTNFQTTFLFVQHPSHCDVHDLKQTTPRTDSVCICASDARSWRVIWNIHAG